jgi:hypothetical protein
MMMRVRSEESIQKDRIRRRKEYDKGQAILRRYKRIKGCSKCGYNLNTLALEFNHINPAEKKFLIAQKCHNLVRSNNTKTKREIKEEIFKCEVVCCNCHSILTYEKRHYAIERKSRL